LFFDLAGTQDEDALARFLSQAEPVRDGSGAESVNNDGRHDDRECDRGEDLCTGHAGSFEFESEDRSDGGCDDAARCHCRQKDSFVAGQAGSPGRQRHGQRASDQHKHKHNAGDPPRDRRELFPGEPGTQENEQDANEQSLEDLRELNERLSPEFGIVGENETKHRGGEQPGLRGHCVGNRERQESGGHAD
jgi:hypothetical protein